MTEDTKMILQAISNLDQSLTDSRTEVRSDLREIKDDIRELQERVANVSGFSK